jgi:hypothetical protein
LTLLLHSIQLSWSFCRNLEQKRSTPSLRCSNTVEISENEFKPISVALPLQLQSGFRSWLSGTRSAWPILNFNSSLIYRSGMFACSSSNTTMACPKQLMLADKTSLLLPKLFAPRSIWRRRWKCCRRKWPPSRRRSQQRRRKLKRRS